MSSEIATEQVSSAIVRLPADLKGMDRTMASRSRYKFPYSYGSGPPFACNTA